MEIGALVMLFSVSLFLDMIHLNVDEGAFYTLSLAQFEAFFKHIPRALNIIKSYTNNSPLTRGIVDIYFDIKKVLSYN